MVDLQDPTSFPTIQTAVDAAAPGDVVLVRTATSAVLSAFSIDGKGISVIADGAVTVKGQVSISNLPSDEYVVLRDLDARLLGSGVSIGQGLGLELNTCAGTVWIEGVTTSQILSAGSQGTPILHADACNAALVNHSVLDGSGVTSAFPFLSLRNDGVQVENSRVVLIDTQAIGNEGADTIDDVRDAGFGGDGLKLVSGSAFAAGSDFTGGSGGDGGHIGIGCVPAADGGAGVTVDPSASIDYYECTFTPALGGAPCNNLNPPGEDGVPIEGLATDQAEPYRDLSVVSPVRGGETSSFQATGVPGDLGFLAFGAQASSTPFVNNGGYLLLPLIPSFLSLGPVDASGNFSLDVTWPPLPVGVDVLEFYSQVFVIDAGGKAILGGATSLFVLNQAF